MEPDFTTVGRQIETFDLSVYYPRTDTILLLAINIQDGFLECKILQSSMISGRSLLFSHTQ